MAAPLIVRLVMDAAGYLKTVDTAVASNTKLEESSLGVGEAMQVSATKSVQASLRATEGLKTQLAGYRELAVSAEQSAAVRERAALLASKAEGRLNAQLGLSSGLVGTSRAAQTAERDLGKTTRGLLAGSGAAAGLGRSLAFASTGFIAIAGGATLLRASIKSALDLAKTQRQVDAQLATSGKSWDQYGQQIDQADLKLSHLSGFTNQELLQGFGFLVRGNNNVGESLKLTAEAADVARGRNISLASAAIALAKAQGGSLTALRRLGIVIPANVKGMAALNYVQEKFAGQAKAGATVSDRFHASLVNTEEIIGTGLLPTFTRLTREAGNYLARMNQTGRLQRDVNEAVSIGGTVFHTLGAVIGFVDKVTGSFKNTLEVLIGIFAVKKILVFGDALLGLAAKWGLVTTAATEAAAAETVAAGEGAAVGGAALVGGAAAGGAALSAPLVGGAAALGFIAYKGLTSGTGPSKVTTGVSGSQTRVIVEGVGPMVKQNGRWYRMGRGVLALASPDQAALAQSISSGAAFAPNVRPQLPGVSGRGFTPSLGGGFTPTRRTPIAVYSQYTQTITEQLAVAQAGLTRSTKDDVSAAKRIIARIKRLIDHGHLAGASLVQALQDEASQQGVLDNARQTAAQQAARVAAAKKAAASSYTTPIDLQLAEARAQLTATSADDISVERRILRAAKAAIASGKKNKQGQLAALQIELQAQQAIQSFTGQGSTTFTEPLRLQLALAKAQATGGNQTAILLKMKAALERALKSAKGNIQKQIDIYNQIASINQQLGSSAASALGGFKQASTRALTANLGLTAAQRKALRARLSQLGPGGTTSGEGVGAYGYRIGRGGRPVHHHHHHVTVEMDGDKVSKKVTHHQQKHRRGKSSQTRGPNAGVAYGT